MVEITVQIGAGLVVNCSHNAGPEIMTLPTQSIDHEVDVGGVSKFHRYCTTLVYDWVELAYERYDAVNIGRGLCRGELGSDKH